MKRRVFLETSAACGISVLFSDKVFGVDENRYPFQSLEEAFSHHGFDPSENESFLVVWASDTHYGIGNPARILSPILNEVLDLKPLPAFLGICGDLICKASLHFGQVPDDRQKADAIQEFRMLKKDLDRVEGILPVRIALGNHDTYPGEDTPLLFHAVFPERPEYHSFSIRNVRFIFLNGGCCGVIDAKQESWFRREIHNMPVAERTLILVCHQPALGHLVSERGIPRLIRETLADWDGETWMVAGHEHINRDSCYRLPKTVITQATITSANPVGWGTENPGYWIYGFHRGRLAVRVFRRLGKGYRAANPPPVETAAPIRLPFEGIEDLLWKVEVGDGDRQFLVEADAAWCLNYWHYTKKVVYRFPLSLGEEEATRLVVLDEIVNDRPGRYFLSPDGKRWTEVREEMRADEYAFFLLPGDCREAGTVFVRVENRVVGGFGFLK